jgi:hypothetical protein
MNDESKVLLVMFDKQTGARLSITLHDDQLKAVCDFFKPTSATVQVDTWITGITKFSEE